MACDGAGTVHHPANINYTVSTDLFDDALERKDFPSILTNKDLFWTAFCKAIAPYPAENYTPFPSFSCRLKERTITIRGNDERLPLLQNIVQSLATVLWEKSQRKEDVEILFIKGGFIHPAYEEGRLISYQNHHLLCETFSIEPVRMALPTLVKFCGATATEGHFQNIPLLTIQWIKDHHLSSTITPQPLSSTPDLGAQLYQLQQNQRDCDFSLQGKGVDIRLHKIVLWARGGPVLQAVLNNPLKESLQQFLSLPYSRATLQVFIEYLYLDGPAVLDKYRQQENIHKINTVELLTFAHTYQLDSLLDCATNLLAIYAQPSDIKILQPLAEKFNNPHLKELCAKLSENLPAAP